MMFFITRLHLTKEKTTYWHQLRAFSIGYQNRKDHAHITYTGLQGKFHFGNQRVVIC